MGAADLGFDPLLTGSGSSPSLDLMEGPQRIVEARQATT
jgi:hypothetical protein